LGFQNIRSGEDLECWTLKADLFLAVILVFSEAGFAEEVMERTMVLVVEALLTTSLGTVFLIDLVAGQQHA
jgi:hypothetical protein